MTEGQHTATDQWLRQQFQPDTAAVRRVAGVALRSPEPEPGPRGVRRLLPWAAGLAAVVLAVLWLRSPLPVPPTPEPVRIANVGELVTVVDPAGGISLHAPPHPTDRSEPRMIITLRGANAP